MGIGGGLFTAPGDQGDEVTAWLPVGRDVEVPCHRPAAARDRTVLGRRVLGAFKAGHPKQGFVTQPVAPDLDVVVRSCRVDVKRQRFAGVVAHAVRIGPDLEQARIVARHIVIGVDDVTRAFIGAGAVAAGSGHGRSLAFGLASFVANATVAPIRRFCPWCCMG